MKIWNDVLCKSSRTRNQIDLNPCWPDNILPEAMIHSERKFHYVHNNGMYKVWASTLRKNFKYVTTRCLLVSRNCKSSAEISSVKDKRWAGVFYGWEFFTEGRVSLSRQKRNSILSQTRKDKSYAGGTRHCLQVVSTLQSPWTDTNCFRVDGKAAGKKG